LITFLVEAMVIMATPLTMFFMVLTLLWQHILWFVTWLTAAHQVTLLPKRKQTAQFL
jgi:hypothetical protein